MNQFNPVQKADIATQLINGLDIHPVAVEMSRVNLERTLPARPSKGASALRIYLGDSLHGNPSEHGDVFYDVHEHLLTLTTPKGNHVYLPVSFVKLDTFPEYMRQLVDAARNERPYPDYITNGLSDTDVLDLQNCHQQLCDVIREEGNSVWTWYAINLVAPYLLALRKIDRIVANPPWVKLAEIQVDHRRVTMEKLGDSLNIRESGKQAPHTDIASYFILAARALYMSSPKTDPAAWLVKKSAISSGQWNAFREVHKGRLKQSVDLELLQPFGGGDARRSCLLMEHRPMRKFNDVTRLEADLVNKHDKPMSWESLRSARTKFNFVKVGKPIPRAQSEYLDRCKIRQGATLVPHVLALVDKADGPDHQNMLKVTTRQSSKIPWNQVKPQTGLVPAHWVRPVLTSSKMLSYHLRENLLRGIVPTDLDGKLLETPGDVSHFWGELDEIYQSKAGIGKGTPKTLLSQFDYQSKLSAQLDDSDFGKWMVLYPSSGDIMRAARTQGRKGVANSNLFWFIVRNKAEAGYLTALLNASCLRRAFKESRDSGRDFQLHPWRRVPIPYFDKDIPLHRRLANLCVKAESIANSVVEDSLVNNPALGQVGLSARIREAVYSSNAGKEIERIVHELMPAQADPIQ